MKHKNKKVTLYSLKKLIEYSLHLGHNKKLRNPNSKPLILGTRNKVDILNINETVTNLSRILPFIIYCFKQNGRVLIITHKKDTANYKEITKHVCATEKWFPGSLSNFHIVREKNTVPFLPNLVVMIDNISYTAILKEIKTLRIPIISTVDSNINPIGITYPLPSNDDSIQSQNFFLTLLKQLMFIAFTEKTKKFKKLIK